MWGSLLPNGHLVGTSEASRQSLSQSPLLGRHGNKQMGAQEMGERSQREAGRCTIISDPVTCSGHGTQPCGHPVCFTDQRTQYLLSSSIPLTQIGSTSPHTHTHMHTHRGSHTSPYKHILSHTHSLTQPHTPSQTTHTPSYITCTLLTHSTNTYTLHTLTHTISSHTHTLTHTDSSYPHTHTLHTLTHTQTHTLLTFTHKHTITEPTGVKTQETWGPRGSAHTPGTWSMWEQPRVPAELSHWSFHTLGASGTPRSSLRKGRQWRDSG